MVPEAALPSTVPVVSTVPEFSAFPVVPATPDAVTKLVVPANAVVSAAPV